MRVALPHRHSKDEVRRRLRARSGEIAQFVPGGFADVQTAWPSEDRMSMVVRAMGQQLNAHVDIEESQVVFVVDLPPALGFVEPIVAGAIRDKGTKLLK
jgi:hypothetical protein